MTAQKPPHLRKGRVRSVPKIGSLRGGVRGDDAQQPHVRQPRDAAPTKRQSARTPSSVPSAGLRGKLVLTEETVQIGVPSHGPAHPLCPGVSASRCPHQFPRCKGQNRITHDLSVGGPQKTKIEALESRTSKEANTHERAEAPRQPAPTSEKKPAIPAWQEPCSSPYFFLYSGGWEEREQTQLVSVRAGQTPKMQALPPSGSEAAQCPQKTASTHVGAEEPLWPR